MIETILVTFWIGIGIGIGIGGGNFTEVLWSPLLIKQKSI